ncbi:hypothetical protein QOT17_000730 [Balamuthia mandrillaris]
MFSLRDLMKQVEAQQREAFASQLEDRMSWRSFLQLYLLTFLGDPFPLRTKQEQHKAIDGISLCAAEITFLHDLVDLEEEPKSTLLARAIELCKNTDELEQCQLGPNMLAMLEAAQKRSVQFV